MSRKRGKLIFLLIVLFLLSSSGAVFPLPAAADFETNFGTRYSCNGPQKEYCYEEEGTTHCCRDLSSPGTPICFDVEEDLFCETNNIHTKCKIHCYDNECQDWAMATDGTCSCSQCIEEPATTCEDPWFESDSRAECTDACANRGTSIGEYNGECCICRDTPCYGGAKVPESECKVETYCPSSAVDVIYGDGCCNCLFQGECSEGVYEMDSEEICQYHCRGEYSYDENGCCECTGTSFTDEDTCMRHCTDEGKWYSYDPETPPYCTCKGNYVPTEESCKLACYRSNYEDYRWDESKPKGFRCTCIDPDGGEHDPDGRYTRPGMGIMDLEAPIGTYNTTDSITGYIKQIYLFASGIVGGLAAIMIVIGGIQYSTAAGNQRGIASAKETITSAIIGLVIVGASYLILGVFGTQFTKLKEPDLDPVTVTDEGSEAEPRKIACGSSGICELLATNDSGVCADKRLGDPCTAASEECSRYNNSPSQCSDAQGCESCYMPVVGHSCIDSGSDCASSQAAACQDDVQGCRPSQHCQSVDDKSNPCQEEMRNARAASNRCKGCKGVELRIVSGGVAVCCKW